MTIAVSMDSISFTLYVVALTMRARDFGLTGRARNFSLTMGQRLADG
jgi:hypothetical protein